MVDYLRRNKSYALIIDASLGGDKKPWVLGAISTQINPDGQHCVIAYASRKLQRHECNYTPILLEMQATIWRTDHFGTYLLGKNYTDNRPQASRKIRNAIQFYYNKLMNDGENEI
jgi:RNase H-like domain found in reverse transcriptase